MIDTTLKWDQMNVDHIGYLCSNISNSVREFENLGYTRVSEIITDDQADDGGRARNVSICFMQNRNIRIELVCPIDENSDVYNMLKRGGSGPYHICYQVDDIESRIVAIQKERWIILKKPARAIALGNARVAFLVKHSVGIIELVETKGQKNEAI